MKKLILIFILSISIASYGEFNFLENSNKTDANTEFVVNEDDTHSYEKNMEKGEKAFKNENYVSALNYYMEAFNNKEDDLDALFGIAKSYEEMNQVNKALGVYRKIVVLDPKNKIANKKLLILEQVNLSKWNFEKKEHYFESFENYLAHEHYDNSEDIYTLGRIYMNDELFERAYNIFRKDKHGDYRNLFGAATTARLLGKYQTSIKYYNKLLAENPDFYMGYLGLASTYKVLKNYDLALVNLEKYLKYQEDENAYVGMADIYMAQDRYDRAKAILEKGNNKFPDSAKIKKSLGEVYSKE